MTFLFKNKAFALFLLPLMSLTKSKTKIYDLEASYKKYTDRIELNWKRDLIKKDEIIEIQRSLHNKNKYLFLPLKEEQKKNESLFYADKYQLTLSYYDYRLRVVSKTDTSLWSNIAVGAIIPSAIPTQPNEDTSLAPCSATYSLSLNKISKIKDGYQLDYVHGHDCGKVHEPQVFLSKDNQLDNTDPLLLVLSKTDTTIHVQIGKLKTENCELILKIGNQVDALKIKP
jgi:hypothetical protein